MVDQTTRGHQFILKNFGADAAPRATWQIDPFGHSNTQAALEPTPRNATPSRSYHPLG